MHKADPVKTAKPTAAATAATGNVSVQAKKEEAKPTQKVEDPKTNPGGGCPLYFHYNIDG